MKKLYTENLVKIYKKRRVVNDVSLEVRQGEVVGLLGPNGAGKTTTFYMIVGLISPESGNVFYDDKQITEYPMYRRSRLGIGYLTQEASIFRGMNVMDNVLAALETKPIPRKERLELAKAYLNELGIYHLRKSKTYVLSGGERRRLEIARALSINPSFILLDEPFAGVDPIAVEDIQNIIMKLKEKNIGILITDHNVRETLSITDHAYILFEGRILLQGTAEELINDKQARKIYLGEKFKL